MTLSRNNIWTNCALQPSHINPTKHDLPSRAVPDQPIQLLVTNNGLSALGPDLLA